MNLSPLETDYFVHLVLAKRAGTQELRQFYQTKLTELRSELHKVTNRVGPALELTETDKARFYSDALYTLIRGLTAIPRYQDPDALQAALQLPPDKVSAIVQFLVSRNLCTRSAAGTLGVGPQQTHIPATSPLVTTHHRNWRQKAVQFYEKMDQDDLVFTAVRSNLLKSALADRC